MSVFRFKQFEVRDHYSAMKVGTDGVLLGAWVNLHNIKRVVDVGAGTGLISLMLTQRNPKLKVTALEIDEDAAKDASFNFTNSPWSDRLTLKIGNALEMELLAVDLLVSNPPFFTNSMKPDKLSRSYARHDDTLNFKEILQLFSRSTASVLAVIYPFDRLDEIKAILRTNKMHIQRICEVFPTPDKVCSRVLIEVSKKACTLLEEQLIIEEFGRHQYSQAYINLTSAFYLKM